MDAKWTALLIGGVGAEGYVAAVRAHASVLHLDLDAFFAAVEQRDKPSLRGKPVVVGGVGGRGVVATASYEARKYGVRSAMSTREARSRCPHAAFLTGRFHAYRDASTIVMGLLRAASPLVEPLSLDEAFVDLAVAQLDDLEVPTVTAFAEELRARVTEATGGLTASVGIGSSKFIAKVASDLDKPDGLVVVPPGTEQELLRPMHVTVIPGVGPATAERLRRVGIHTVAELESVSLDELVRLVGKSHGAGLYALARADDDRPVEPDRETKSVSSEGTYDTDLTDRSLMEHLLTRQATDVATRLRKHGLSGRTVTIKVRLHDFTTLNRSTTLPSPTDSSATVARLARGPAGRPRHVRRGPAPRRRCLRAGRLDPGGPVRRDRGGGRAGGTRGRGDPVPRQARLVARDGRRPRRAGPGLGLGLGARGGDGPLRDRGDPGRSGALVRRRRPGAAAVAAGGSSGRGGLTSGAVGCQHPLETGQPSRAWLLTVPVLIPRSPAVSATERPSQ